MQKEMFKPSVMKALKAPHQRVKKEPKIWKLSDVLPFGQYARCSVKKVAEINPQYLAYLQHTYHMQFDAEVRSHIILTQNLAR